MPPLQSAWDQTAEEWIPALLLVVYRSLRVTLFAGFLYALANEFFISIPVSCTFAQPSIALVSAPPLLQTSLVRTFTGEKSTVFCVLTCPQREFFILALVRDMREMGG